MPKIKSSEDLLLTGERIRQKRKDAGLSQEALAEKINVSGNTIHRIESAQMVMGVDKLFLLAKALNVSIEELCPEQLVFAGKNSTFEKLAFSYSRLTEANQNAVYETMVSLINVLLKQQSG